MKSKKIIQLFLPLFLTLILLPVFGGLAHGQTPDPAAPTPVLTPQAQPSASAEARLSEIPTRTPVPTATPGTLQEAIDEVAEATGLDEVYIIGFPAEGWINVFISLLIVLAGYFAGTWIIRGLLPRFARKTPTEFDDRLLKIVGPNIRWLVVLFILQFALARLYFISEGLKTILRDVVFLVTLAIVFRIFWQLIGFAERWFTEKFARVEREQELEPVIKLLVILAKVFVCIVASAILLTHFGIDITIFAATLGILGLALSLGARDIVADILSGITILIDRPFRIGDRIGLQSIETWGDVSDIGLRSTSILTRDNRMVVVPNSVIANNEVVNFSYPDPTFRYETHVHVAYGIDVEHAQQIIINTVKRLEEVIEDRPVEALYIEMADSFMIFRVRWWMDSYVDTRRILDKVHKSIQAALNADGITIPFPAFTLKQDLFVDSTSEETGILDKSNE